MIKSGTDWKAFLKGNKEQFDFAIVDPPWKYDDRHPALDEQLDYELWLNNSTELDHLLANINSRYIFLWTTNSMVEEAVLAISRNPIWKYKTLITWVKTTKNGKIHYGLGNNFRGSTEQMILIVRENEKPLRLKERNVFMGRPRSKTGKSRGWESKIVNTLMEKGLTKGLYLFSGKEDLDVFEKFDLTCVDIELRKK